MASESRQKFDKIGVPDYILDEFCTPMDWVNTPFLLTNDTQMEPVQPKRRKHRRTHYDFTLLVKNINTSLLVGDFKAALKERGIKPRDIDFRQNKGTALLHFVNEIGNNIHPGLNAYTYDVIEILEDLPIPTKRNKTLIVELQAKMEETGDAGGLSEDENLESAD